MQRLERVHRPQEKVGSLMLLKTKGFASIIRKPFCFFEKYYKVRLVE